MQPDLIVFGEDWGAHPSATQHLMRNLAGTRRIIWVNSIGLRRPRLTLRDVRRAGGKLMSMARRPDRGTRPKQCPDSMTVISPVAISWPGNPLAHALNQRTLSWQISRTIAEMGMSRPIVWTSLPTACFAKGSLQERALVYYCGDDFGALSGVDHRAVTKMEKVLAERADLIFAASEKLAERFPCDKTILLPHGVDVELFAKPAAPASDMPRGRPVAGFYGSISEWIDLELIVQAATELPDWNIVLIGPVRIDITRLRHIPNIHVLGERPHAALPHYVQHWQAALLPFKRNLQIEACNPLKLREYLAAGTPIVSTAFPALEPYRDLIEIADQPADFGRAIRRAAADVGRNRLRSTRVSRESWAGRTSEVAAALAAL